MEEWKDIPGYVNYRISSLGRVMSLKGQKILSLSISSSGYRTILLCNGPGNQQRKTIHRLIAIAFIPNPDNKEMVDHINRNKLDNRIENLRWATRSENCLNNDKTKTSTDESYIYVSFRVAVPGHKEKRFKTLEEAVKYKNSLLTQV